jgi:hypothetical protein
VVVGAVGEEVGADDVLGEEQPRSEAPRRSNAVGVSRR